MSRCPEHKQVRASGNHDRSAPTIYYGSGPATGSPRNAVTSTPDAGTNLLGPVQ
jgi:hypothetical protein